MNHTIYTRACARAIFYEVATLNPAQGMWCGSVSALGEGCIQPIDNSKTYVLVVLVYVCEENSIDQAGGGVGGCTLGVRSVSRGL